MRSAARNVVLVRHTYNLVELPIVAGKSGTAEFGTRDSKGACHSIRGSSVSCPRTRGHGGRSQGTEGHRRRLSLVVLAFAYDSRTKGNAATEIVKYYMQLHFGIKKDYRIPNLLKRGNFYQSN